MKRKDIYLARLEPVEGSEQGGVRPVVVVSGDSMNDYFSVHIVCCISTVIKNYKGCVVLKKSKDHGLKSESEIITFQIRTLSSGRFLKKIGQITEEEFSQVLIGLNQICRF